MVCGLRERREGGGRQRNGTKGHNVRLCFGFVSPGSHTWLLPTDEAPEKPTSHHCLCPHSLAEHRGIQNAVREGSTRDRC